MSIHVHTQDLRPIHSICHKKYNGANTGENNKEPYKQNSPHLMRLRENKRFFNEKGQGGNIDYNGIDSENGNRYNKIGSNPGDVLFDDTIYDLYTDPNIWDAFMEYLERERPELLMPSILDIPTRPHKFAHFAVMPETLVDPLIKVIYSVIKKNIPWIRTVRITKMIMDIFYVFFLLFYIIWK